MRRRFLAVVLVFLTVAGTVAAVAAQGQTGTQFYTAYRAAFDKAKSVEDLLPYMASERRKEIESTPPDMMKKMFGAIKAIGSFTNMKVVKETRSDNGATLAVEAVDSEKAKVTGTITLVKENGAWKVSKESFKS